jgi:XisI protein
MEEKVIKYQAIIIAFLERQAQYRQPNNQLETQLILDKQNHHYQLLRLGFRKGQFVYMCPFHFDIKNNKIWIQQNRTDVEVGHVFMEMGVPKTDIVVGFLPIETRAFSGYAVN